MRFVTFSTTVDGPSVLGLVTGEEVVDPERTIPRAIPIALGITLVVYATVAVSALLAVGPEQLAASSAPLAPRRAMICGSLSTSALTSSWGSTSSAAAMRFIQPSESERMPVSSRPIVWAVVGGAQRAATSAKVRPF